MDEATCSPKKAARRCFETQPNKLICAQTLQSRWTRGSLGFSDTRYAKTKTQSQAAREAN